MPGSTDTASAATVREAEHVVELVVDVLCLPFAIHGPDPLGDVVVVARTVGDGSVEPIAHGPQQVGPQQLVGGLEGAGLGEPAAQRFGVVDAELAGAGRRSSDQVVVERSDVHREVFADLGQHVIERRDRFVAAERVEHTVLLVGEYSLDLAGAADDQWNDRLVTT